MTSQISFRITANDLPEIAHQYGEGLIIQDYNENPYEAANIVNQTFTYGGILLGEKEFQQIIVFQNEGRTNFLFLFSQVELDMGKLVMWQFLTYKSCHSIFLTDYNQGKRIILREKW